MAQAGDGSVGGRWRHEAALGFGMRGGGWSVGPAALLRWSGGGGTAVRRSGNEGAWVWTRRHTGAERCTGGGVGVKRYDGREETGA